MPEAVSPLATTRTKQRVPQREKCSRAWQKQQQQHTMSEVNMLRRCQVAVRTDDININENRNDNENSTVKYAKDTADNTNSCAEGAVAATAATSVNDDVEICEKLHWLEKVYALNRKIQQEEEIMLKLHAKIRKHQVRRAYQTKDEVLQQIDALDLTLARQGADLKKVENTLAASNEQLKEKLCILEKLSQDFMQQSNIITNSHNVDAKRLESKNNIVDVDVATKSISNTSNCSTNVILSKTTAADKSFSSSGETPIVNKHAVVNNNIECMSSLAKHEYEDVASSAISQQNVLLDNITSTDLSHTKHINKLMFDEQLLQQSSNIPSISNSNAVAAHLKQPQFQSAAIPSRGGTGTHQLDITQLGTLV